MDSPNPLLVAPALLWTAVAAAALLTSIALSVRAIRAERRPSASDAWNPVDTDFPVIAVGAIAGYAAAAIVVGRFSPGSAAFGILWPAAAGSAFTYAAGRRTSSWPRWAGPAFAAAGAALYGSLQA